MKTTKILLAVLTLVGGFSTQSAFAKLQGCDSAAQNIYDNGGHCSNYGCDYFCTGASGNRYVLTPGSGPTGCDMDQINTSTF